MFDFVAKWIKKWYRMYLSGLFLHDHMCVGGTGVPSHTDDVSSSMNRTVGGGVGRDGGGRQPTTAGYTHRIGTQSDVCVCVSRACGCIRD